MKGEVWDYQVPTTETCEQKKQMKINEFLIEIEYH